MEKFEEPEARRHDLSADDEPAPRSESGTRTRAVSFDIAETAPRDRSVVSAALTGARTTRIAQGVLRPSSERAQTAQPRGTRIQAKLQVGATNDPAEREADRIADQVLTNDGNQTGPTEQPEPSIAPSRGAGGADGFAVDGSIEREIGKRAGSGSPLPPQVKADMEPRFGADFSAVRVHSGPDVAKLNDGLGARAFTYGNDIFFGRGETMAGDTGRHLVAHELTHVLQQNGDAQRKPVVRRVTKPEKVKWNTADPTSKAGVCPSSDGAMGGVVFITVGTETHVIKPGEGSAANTMFAEEVLEKVGGAQTSESRPVMLGTQTFTDIIAVLDAAKAAADAATAAADLVALRARWAANIDHFRNAPFLLMQKSMKSADLGTRQRPGANNEEFSDVYKNDPLAALNDPGFLQSVGRTLVADTVLGNADRLEAINGGNFFVLGNSKVGAIDNEAFLPSMSQVQAYAATDKGAHLGGLHLAPQRQWVEYLVNGGAAMRKDAPVSNLEQVMGSIDRWIRTFATGFLKGADAAAVQRRHDLAAAGFTGPGNEISFTPAEFLGNANWARVHADLMVGYERGLRELEKHLGSLSKRFIKLQEEYGADDIGLNYGAFQVRAAYIAARKAGDDHGAAVDKANNLAASLVSDKTRRVIAFGHQHAVLTDAERDQLLIAMSELSSKEQKALIHIRPVLKKKVGARGDDDSYEQLRATLLRDFIQAWQVEANREATATTQAYTNGVVEAKRIHSWFGKVTDDDGIRAIWNSYHILVPANL